MITKTIQAIILSLAAFALTACMSRPSDARLMESQPAIYPDYIGVTVPATIAPMNFCLPADDGSQLPVYVEVKGSKGGEMASDGDCTDFDIDAWHDLLSQNKGGELVFTVFAKHDDGWRQYKDFTMDVSNYALDEWGLTYRRIAPGYEVYSKMGLYERDLSSFDEYEIMENTRVPGMCINCHTSNRTDPKQTLFHVRGDKGATVLRIDGKTELLNTKTDSTLASCVYPYWHPQGRYIAFSTNATLQSFHSVADKRIEVFDKASDLQVYDTKTHELLLTPLLKDTSRWETFPAFSADGKRIFFCSTTRTYSIPEEVMNVRYNLCSIDFDASNGTYGSQLNTLIDAERDSMSVSIPRPSYDGRFLMYTRCQYGTFPIWHKEADLWLLDLNTGTDRPLTEVNSNDTESFHNWSTNSHWFVFSSRRGDGLYTRLYLASIDEKGRCTKPFLLPQRNPKKFYSTDMYSYNVPDFTSERVMMEASKTADALMSDEREQIKVKTTKMQ